MNLTTAAWPIGNRNHRRGWPGIVLILASLASSGLGADRLAPNTEKVRIKDRQLTEQLLERGGKLVADYGSFQIVATEQAGALRSGRGGKSDQVASDIIELNAKQLRTRSVGAGMGRPARGNFAGRQLHLVQFIGPVKPEWRDALEQSGVKVISYVPENAYLVRGNAAELAALQAWATTADFVQWEGEFANSYKLHPNTQKVETWLTNETDAVFAIQLLEDAESTPATVALIARLKLAPVQRDFRVMQYRNLIVRLPNDCLTELSARPDVVSVQRYDDPDKRDERQAQIMAGNLMGGLPGNAGYLTWLAERGFTQAQFDASGFLVDLSDSGIDNGTTTPGHFGLYANANPLSGSRVVYNRLVGTAHGGSTLAGCDGHGNLNAHILAGAVHDRSGFPHADAGGFLYGLGVCPFVRVGSSVVFDPDLFTNPNYADLQSRAYLDGARISANSWGMTNNAYTVDAQAYDALVRDAQPEGAAFAAAGNQEMVIVFAAGNRGPVANTVGSPGTAKNVITVGASENVRSLSSANGGKSTMGSDGCGYPDSNGDNANDVATFSSRGPCSDGRMKPDLVAPGTHIVGGVPQLTTATTGFGAAIECFKAASICALSGGGTVGSTNNFFPQGQQFYTVSSGTSHATPAVAGACALVRQYFINQAQLPPSPAMTKAFLMNSARYLTGAGANDSLWSPAQGMGAVNLGRAFDLVPRILRDQLAGDVLTASGQTRVFTGRIVNTNEPLRITVAWTDAPGSTIGNAFNNDLDLTVQVAGEIYPGNSFSGDHSVPGGSADARNNVESVFLPAGVGGDVIITVTAANINSDGVPNFGGGLDQDFALVVYNATNISVPIIKATAANLSAEGFTPANQVPDPGEMVTVALTLKNSGTRAATNLLVTLLATNGVSAPTAPVNFGNISAPDELVTRAFTFVANGPAGDTIAPTFQLSDSGGYLGIISVSLALGQRIVETHSYTNASAITIPDSGAASPYPSLIVVAGVTGVVKHISATLRGFSHSWPDDVDVLLASPTGAKVLLLSDCGGGNARNGVTLTFDDDATTTAPDSGAIVSGLYKPTNIDTTTDNLPNPAPGGTLATNLGVFNGSSPNGNWGLFIQDDGAMDSGSLTQGWVLTVTTSNLVWNTGLDCAADLGVWLTSATNVVTAGSNFTLTVTVTNRGPSPATYTALTNMFPFGYIPQATTVSQGEWHPVGGAGWWQIGNIPPGAAASASFSGKCIMNGALTNVCTVGSFTPEVQSGDNITGVSLLVVKGSGAGLGVSSNSPPVLATLPDRMVHAGSRIQFVATATDAETNSLSFTLGPGAPPEASIEANTGSFLWQTSDAAVSTTNVVTIQVSDNGIPSLSSSRSFAISVLPRPAIAGIAVHGGVVTVEWSAIAGQGYELQTATNLAADQWAAAAPVIIADGNRVTYSNNVGMQAQQFFRVLVLP